MSDGSWSNSSQTLSVIGHAIDLLTTDQAQTVFDRFKFSVDDRKKLFRIKALKEKYESLVRSFVDVPLNFTHDEWKRIPYWEWEEIGARTQEVMRGMRRVERTLTSCSTDNLTHATDTLHQDFDTLIQQSKDLAESKRQLIVSYTTNSEEDSFLEVLGNLEHLTERLSSLKHYERLLERILMGVSVIWLLLVFLDTPLGVFWSTGVVFGLTIVLNGVKWRWNFLLVMMFRQYGKLKDLLNQKRNSTGMHWVIRNQFHRIVNETTDTPHQNPFTRKLVYHGCLSTFPIIGYQNYSKMWAENPNDFSMISYSILVAMFIQMLLHLRAWYNEKRVGRRRIELKMNK